MMAETETPTRCPTPAINAMAAMTEQMDTRISFAIPY